MERAMRPAANITQRARDGGRPQRQWESRGRTLLCSDEVGSRWPWLAAEPAVLDLVLVERQASSRRTPAHGSQVTAG